MTTATVKKMQARVKATAKAHDITIPDEDSDSMDDSWAPGKVILIASGGLLISCLLLGMMYFGRH